MERLIIRNEKLKESPLGGLMDNALGQKARPKDQKKKGKGRRAYDSSDSSDDDQEKLPLGHNYAGDFPSLPDFDGKGKAMRQANERRMRVQATSSQWANVGKNTEFNFRTNHAQEVSVLNQIKSNYKQLSNTVI